MVSFLSALALTVAAVHAQMPGGWAPVTDPAVQTQLQTAVADPCSYANTTTPLCATQTVWAQQQVVAGVKYHVGVRGCAAAADAVVGCTCTDARDYTVTLLELAGQPLRIVDVASAPETAASVAAGGGLGGFSAPRAVTPVDKLLYVRAVMNDAHFAASDIPRVCATRFESVATQVVAGTNYRFLVHGCTVPAGPVNDVIACSCAATAPYRVEIYEDLINALKVTSAARQ
uniref:Secreted protein n=1 Tax=Achlya hypogyna TaxID=1202772 RepID=A0A0A7CNJ1_ACHHY|nr:secreted protein [Achlya hypogyna]